MSDFPSLLIVLLLGLLFLKRHLGKDANLHNLLYPPGPRPLPVIGNILDIPRVTPWVTYTNWRKRYGDLIHISALGQHIVVINSMNIAIDLLEKKSSIYSDRPDMPMVDLTGWSINIAALRYGCLWRKHRRLFHRKFNRDSVIAFRPLELGKTREMLRDLLNTPEEFSSHLRNLTASVIMYITYGHEIAPREDPLVATAGEASRMVSEAILFGSVLIRLFPFVRYLPAWIPGVGFKRVARKCREKVDEMQNVPFRSVRQHMAAGTSVPCWTTEMLEANDLAGGDKEEEDIIKAVSATGFAAAYDTTTSSLQSFFLAMTLYPEVQARAQAEIGAVIGHSRLPDFDDRESLPYIEAMCREVLRWRPPTPLGVPHSTLEDDVYNRYFIPQGAIIFANLWAMCQDDRVYDQPARFMPERFLTPEGGLNEDTTPTFGFGRRICVGRALADATLWIVIVSVLSTFDISTARDEAGREIEVPGTYSDGILIHPLPFKCSVTPRSPETRQLILCAPHVKINSLRIR